ncbi:hypothetical protein V8C37DRAFT_57625 [Trichoderma ceciliae]
MDGMKIRAGFGGLFIFFSFFLSFFGLARLGRRLTFGFLSFCLPRTLEKLGSGARSWQRRVYWRRLAVFFRDLGGEMKNGECQSDSFWSGGHDDDAREYCR